MGTLRKAVVLSEGAKPGIPTLKVEKIDHSSVDIIIAHNIFNYPDILMKKYSTTRLVKIWVIWIHYMGLKKYVTLAMTPNITIFGYILIYPINVLINIINF